MEVSTIRLQMINGQEVYFRAPRHEIHRLIVNRHGRPPKAGRQHVITTEKNIPITVELQEIDKIHIM
ncbi:MAG: hypothetical protein WDA20_12615 [Desulfuromonadales bacterium]